MATMSESGASWTCTETPRLREPTNPILQSLLQTGVMAIIRTPHSRYVRDITRILVESGLTCIEITFTVPRAPDLIAELREDLPNTVDLGAGTVISEAQALQAVAAGASFLVSPGLSVPVMDVARAHRISCYPGASTPTEVMDAWSQGASAVKIFPAITFGPEYLRQLRGPFPDVAFVPTGGVEVDQVSAYIAAGARAVGLGSSLIGDAADGGNLSELAIRAERLLNAVRSQLQQDEA